eukprot:CAMPEP_0170507540 /NCGR_PEP_ID=MMETSP0208-20121228/59180_1 /TAXON_ID=197538 /ORGANISM="Strombidium inclinatum, Strain S3" /LENGTH=57 /DNA_ID=CAMNT_0010789789 /DNA_START=1147 /DNA_END=1320 /DNA_ORIENTATION=-
MAASCDYSSTILLNLINDLLDMAKAENNSFSMSNGLFSVEQALKEALSNLEFLAVSK